MDLYEFRRDYLMGGLQRTDLNDDPIVQFKIWLEEIFDFEMTDPTAMVLATVDSQGQPSQRIVLLKQVNEQGFEFFTNKDSDKGLDIEKNPKVSLHFPWHSTERQVKINGVAKPVSDAENEAYFASRPRESQLAAWASQQSQPIDSKKDLLNAYEQYELQYPEEVPKPEYWGGYRVEPQLIEFWQGGDKRLHDRFVYERQPYGKWLIQRVSP